MDAQGWAESLVGMYYKQLPGQHETFAEGLTVYAEDCQSAGGSAWKRIPLHPIRRSGHIRSLVPKDPIRNRSGATSGMMIRLRVVGRAGV
jgi:hypothetical protein